MPSSTDEYESSESNEEWVSLFHRRFTKQVLVHVTQAFIADQFNLYGLSEIFPNFNKSINILKGTYQPKFSFQEEKLYYMIHQRYILSKPGMEHIYELVTEGAYGFCPRVSCRKAFLLPVGMCDVPSQEKPKLFCHRCTELYLPFDELAQVDSCAFGRTFPHFFALLYPELFPSLRPSEKYLPRIFGFEVEHSAQKEEEGKNK
ncbi:casein kinase II subunit beta [Nematocida sp. AWRm77]|nr:casein kinase II subunit beta [Nematocida sp. AWRm77]